jgi:uncharacterized protein YbjT (DUF2867 family)
VRILLTGANGFIGGHLLAGLIQRGHTIVAAVRSPHRLARQWLGVEAIAADFNRDVSPDVWLPRLAGVDAVVNCAGVLHGGRGQNMAAIHATTPIALFDACVKARIAKVVQISAISADADTDYARTKKQADDHLLALPLDGTVLRPSLVYGDGSYGGTSALRGLAGLPLVTPLIGDDGAAFRPLHVDDLVETVARVLEADCFSHKVLEPVGPERLTTGQVVARYRSWLGLAPALRVSIPLPFMRAVAALADAAGGGPMGSAGLRQLLAGNAGRQPDGFFAKAIGFVPAAMNVRLARRPAQTQDLWNARLYFLRPLLRLALALMWLGSATVGVLAVPHQYAGVDGAITGLGLDPRTIALLFSAADLVIGLALLLRWRPRWLGVAQLVLVAGYTAGLSFLAPGLWLDPFGGLLKNLPILAAISLWMVLEEER